MHFDLHFVLSQVPAKMVGIAVLIAPALQSVKKQIPAVTGWKALALNFLMSAVGVLAVINPDEVGSSATWLHVVELTLTASGIHNIWSRFKDSGTDDPAPAAEAQPSAPQPYGAATYHYNAQTGVYTSTTVPTAGAVTGESMNLFATILGYSLALLPTIVTGIQTEVGDSQSGATKQQMANDALAAALQGASAIFPAGSTNAALAGASGAAAAQIISVSSSIASVLSHLGKTNAVKTAVNLTKATGAYQAATAANVAATTQASSGSTDAGQGLGKAQDTASQKQAS